MSAGEYVEALAENASIGWGQEGLDETTAQSARDLHGLLKDSIAPGEREHFWPQVSMRSDTNAVAVGQMLTDALSRDESLRPAMQAIAGELGASPSPSPSSSTYGGGETYGNPNDNAYGIPTRRSGGYDNGGFPGFAG